MSETKFTKGEWGRTIFANGQQRIYRIGRDYKESDIAQTYGDDDAANASLIAAAPEMYAMLETVLSEMHSLIDEANDQRMSRIHPQMQTPPELHDGQTLHEIQILLAKARGEV